MKLFSAADFTLTLTYEGREIFSITLSELQKQRLTVGRTGCDLVLPPEDGLASQHHATLEVRKGRWHLCDAGSRNGIWQDGRRLKGATALAPNQLFVLGACRLAVEKAVADRRAHLLSPHHLLVRLNGPKRGERIALTAFPVLFGKSPEKMRAAEPSGGCQIVQLSETLTSHLHARLIEDRLEAGGGTGLFLQDCGSTNGTYVNGVAQRAEMNRRLLAEGDVLRFATEEFRFLDKAFPHDDPKKSLRKGLVAGVIFLTVVALFGLWWNFCCAPARRLMDEARLLGNQLNHPAAAARLEAALGAPGADQVADALAVLKADLEQWRKTTAQWQTVLARWRKTRLDGDPAPVSDLEPQPRACWPAGLEPQRQALSVLQQLGARYMMLRAALTETPAPLPEALLEALLRQELLSEREMTLLEVAGLGECAQGWQTAYRAWTEPARQDIALIRMLRASTPDEAVQRLDARPKAVSVGRRGVRFSAAVTAASAFPVLRDELAAWERLAAWVRSCRTQTQRTVTANFSVSGPGEETALPEAPAERLPEAYRQQIEKFLLLRRNEAALSRQIGVPADQSAGELERYLNWIRALAAEQGRCVYTLLDAYSGTDAGRAYRAALEAEQRALTGTGGAQ